MLPTTRAALVRVCVLALRSAGTESEREGGMDGGREGKRSRQERGRKRERQRRKLTGQARGWRGARAGSLRGCWPRHAAARGAQLRCPS
eukprot:3383477-Rhodomonas_salina.1